MDKKIDIVNRWFREVWIEGNLATIEKIYEPAPAHECLHEDGTPATGEVLELTQVLRTLVVNKTVRIVKAIEDGPWIALSLEMEGADSASGKPIKMRWQTFMRIENGKIIENHPSVNFINLFEQLGQLPPNSFELMLAGTELN